jgi:Sortase domain
VGWRRDRRHPQTEGGVALIAGHVDSAAAGAGALHGLRTLEVGDTIRVVGLDRRTTTWKVMSQPQYSPKSALPSALFVASGPPRLAVVTCGGPFDAATGHYQDNVIVWAAPAA